MAAAWPARGSINRRLGEFDELGALKPTGAYDEGVDGRGLPDVEEASPYSPALAAEAQHVDASEGDWVDGRCVAFRADLLES